MKILFVIPSLRSGGAERQLMELCKGLLAKGYICHIAVLHSSADGYEQLAKKNGIKLYNLERTSKLDFKSIFKLRRIVLSENYDLLHGFLNLGCIYCVIVSKLCKKPFISSAIRDAKNINWQYAISLWLLSKLSPFFVANSKAGLINRYKKFKPNFHVIYNGLDFNRLNQKENLKLKAHYHHAFLFGMFASISGYKDHDTLIEAVRILSKKGHSFKILCAGIEIKNWAGKTKALQNKLQEYHLEDVVYFLGFKPNVEDYINEVDAVILLTSQNCEEGTSNSLIEAMAASKPIIATKGGGTNEIVIDGKGGILVPAANPKATANAMEILINKEKKRIMMGSFNRATSLEQFSLDRYTSEYCNLYHLATNK